MTTEIPETYAHHGHSYDVVSRDNETWGLQLDGTYLGVLVGPDADEEPDTEWIVTPASLHYEPSKPSFATWKAALEDFLTKTAGEVAEPA